MIRRMTAGDLDQVSRNEAVCFSHPWSKAAFGDALAAEEAIYLVAETDGQIVGHCGVTNVLGEGYITNVAVLPAYRNRKIGQRLLAALLAEGEAAGISAFTLEVRAGNSSAIRIYEKAGFVSAGVRPGFYESPKEDALIMWKR